MKLTMDERLSCSHSYADEDSPHLHCEAGMACDGTAYELCFMDRFKVGMAFMERLANEERNGD